MTGKSRIFYGWWILLGATLALGFSLGLIYYSFSILIVPLEDQFHWTRSQISNAPVIWAVVVFVLMIWVGKLNDTYGPRLVMPVGALISALGLIMMAFMQSVRQYYAANVILAIGMTGLAQPICTSTVARWFEKLRGAAMGTTIAGGAVGTFVASRLWPTVLESYGTRGVYLACAGVALFVLAPFTLLVMWRAPQDVGIKPYGASDEPVTLDPRPSQAPSHDEGLTSAEARRTANFWLAVGFTLFANLAYNAVAMHFVPIFEERGVPRAQASYLLGYTILLSFVGKVTGGWIADHVTIRKFLAMTQIGFSLACGSLLFAGTQWQLPLFVVLWGTCLGFSAGAGAALMPECFGTKQLGAIMSSLFILQVAGAAVGPKISGVIHDATQRYTITYMVGALFYLVTAILVFMVRPVFLSASKRARMARSHAAGASSA